MGIYLNPTNEGFRMAVNSEIYVDKTGLIARTNKCLNTLERFMCVSRPRRFGKSVALQMLVAYYSYGYDSSELFKGFKIETDETFKQHLNKYDVIYLNMQNFLIRAKNQSLTEYLEQRVIADISKTYGDLFSAQETALANVLEEIYSETDRKFIFLIDEWDSVMRERQESEELQKEYLDFIRDLLKDKSYVALAYMTGILPVKKYGIHSALNMFTEYSMTDQYDLEEYTGFTDDEVRELCKRYDMSFEETGSWYDGYQLRNFKHIYNPRSVVSAMSNKIFSSYWTSTETYDALKMYIDMDFDGLRADIIHMLGGGRVVIDTFNFQNDMRNFEIKDDVLTLLVYLGYLAYDPEKKEAFIPNKEIIGEFERSMRVSGWPEVMRVLKASDKLLEDTIAQNEDNVAAALDKAHSEISSILTYNDENSLSCSIGLAYYSARKDYKLIRELPTGKGFADIVFLPLPHTKSPAMVVELKYDKTVDTAIKQIKERHYTQGLEGYSGDILLVGISYAKENKDKPHSCVIEKMRI